MWSRRFERPFILRPLDVRVRLGIAAFTWIPVVVLMLASPIPTPARCAMGLWLAASVVLEVRGWSRQPRLMIWRPGTGWLLEWADAGRRPAHLLGSSRILPKMFALSWRLPSGPRVHMLVPVGPGEAAIGRRLRVLLRYGRENG